LKNNQATQFVPSKLNGVEAARGMAALLVVLVHASSMLAEKKYLGQLPLAGLFKFGHAGVDFFFVLSGFIIYYIHSAELGNREFLRPYWIKRFIRIYPVYWIVMIGYGLLLAVSPTKNLYERIPEVIASAVFLYPHHLGPILGVAWSLSHEILFYLLFSVLFFSRRLGFALLGIWFLLLAMHMITPIFEGPFWGEFVFRLFNFHFLLGMLGAHAVRHWPIRWPLVAMVFGPLLFLTAGLLESWGPSMPHEWPPLHLAYGAGAAATLYGLVGLEQNNRLHVPKWAVAMGAASYSIYLLHTIVIMFLQQGLLWLKQYVPLWSAPTFIAVVVLAVYISMWFSSLIEQPLLRRLRPSRNHVKRRAT
jgi:exopolysaccharide production protein ExoZ